MKIAIIALIALMAIPTVMAQFPLSEYTTITCSSNSTLHIENVESRCIDGVCKNFTTTKETYCDYGCTQENLQPQCAPSPFDATVYYVIPIVLFFVVILIIALRRLTR